MGLVAGVWTGSHSDGGRGGREHAAGRARGGYDLQRPASPSDLLWSVRANLPKFSRKTPNGAISWRSRAQTMSPSVGDIYHSNHLLVPLQIVFYSAGQQC